MRAFTPEISWHNRLPALALDISKPLDEKGDLYRIATGGNDCRIYIWLIDLKNCTSNVTSNSSATSPPEIRIRAGLRRHQKSVGAVRFSQQNLLASGDDDGYIYIWRYKEEESQPLTSQHDMTPAHLQPIQPDIEANIFMNEDGFEDLEVWQQQRVLRGHIEDICDLAWSKDGQFLLSGSVDNSAILWDVTKGSKIWCSDLIKGYVQGVAMDPHQQFMAAISSDRTLRIYQFSDKRLLHATRRMNIKGIYKAFFCDDTVQTFCRRLEFSPDGQFLITPTSRMVEKETKQSQAKQASEKSDKLDENKDSEQSSQSKQHQVDVEMKPENNLDAKMNSELQTPVINLDESHEKQQLADESVENESINMNSSTNHNTSITSISSSKPKKPTRPFNVFLVFRRTSFNKPIHYYPTGREPALCVRFSPVIYKLRENNEINFWDIPYRIVWAVATSRSVIIYDSQQPTPIGYASQIHLARLTDLAWSSNGRFLMVSSYDGYSTMLTFDKEEFGEVYAGPLLEPVTKSTAAEDLKIEEINIGENGEETTKPTKKGQKRSKGPKETIATKKEKINLEGDKSKQTNSTNSENNSDQQVDQEHQDQPAPARAPKKITPIPVSSTILRFLVKKPDIAQDKPIDEPQESGSSDGVEILESKMIEKDDDSCQVIEIEDRVKNDNEAQRVIEQ